MDVKELMNHAQEYFGKADEIYDGTYEFTDSVSGKSAIVEINGNLLKFYSNEPGKRAVYETFLDVADTDGLLKDTVINKIYKAMGTKRMAEQAGSPYHEAVILKADEIKKLEEEVEADKKLLMSKLKENMEANDLFIVVPKTPYSYDFSDFEDLTVRVDGVTGYTMRADDVHSILTDGEVDPEDIDVYECPDYIAEDEDPCPEVQDVDSLQKIYDVYSFFDL